VPNERRYPAIEPVCLAIHLTYQCPLKCGHCCFSSDMTKTGALDIEDVYATIDQACRLPTLSAIGFTGGDPFLQADIVVAGLKRAKAKNMATRIVTSSYWATTPEKAIDRLRPLVEAGLDEVGLSYDDSHVAYIREDNILNAWHAAEHFGIKTTIYMSTDVGDRINGDYVRGRLGASEATNPRLLIIESKVTSTGRATASTTPEQRRARAERDGIYRGPCPSMLRQPSVTPTGKIQPCCGTIPFHAGLCIGEIDRDPVDQAMIAAYQNDLYKWIAFEGPVSVLVQITAGTDAPLAEGDLDGICHACDTLFSSPQYMALAQQYLEGKAACLRVQETVLSAVGLYSPPS